MEKASWIEPNVINIGAIRLKSKMPGIQRNATECASEFNLGFISAIISGFPQLTSIEREGNILDNSLSLCGKHQEVRCEEPPECEIGDSECEEDNCDTGPRLFCSGISFALPFHSPEQIFNNPGIKNLREVPMKAETKETTVAYGFPDEAISDISEAEIPVDQKDAVLQEGALNEKHEVIKQPKTDTEPKHSAVAEKNICSPEDLPVIYEEFCKELGLKSAPESNFEKAQGESYKSHHMIDNVLSEKDVVELPMKIFKATTGNQRIERPGFYEGRLKRHEDRINKQHELYRESHLDYEDLYREEVYNTLEKITYPVPSEADQIQSRPIHKNLNILDKEDRFDGQHLIKSEKNFASAEDKNSKKTPVFRKDVPEAAKSHEHTIREHANFGEDSQGSENGKKVMEKSGDTAVNSDNKSDMETGKGMRPSRSINKPRFILTNGISYGINENAVIQDGIPDTVHTYSQPVRETLKSNVINQIIERAEFRLIKDQAQMIIDLKPDILGRIHLKISQEAGRVMAEIRAENVTTKALIESGLPDLETALSEKGFSFDTVTVSWDSHQGLGGAGSGDGNPLWFSESGQRFKGEGFNQAAIAVKATVPEDTLPLAKVSGVKMYLDYFV